MSSELNALQTRLEQLEQLEMAHAEQLAALTADNAQIKADNAQIKAQSQRERRRLRLQAGLAFCGLLAAVFLSPGNRAAIAQGYGVTLASLNTRLLAVEAKTQFQSADATAKSTTFSGCNLFVNDGGGTTNIIVRNAEGQGLGNLIVGYNELRSNNDVRTGSHNLIVGSQNNYSSVGGIVVGIFNNISAPFASVTGGFNNTASVGAASVSGGSSNQASGNYASVSGGFGNTASGTDASVSGGSNITESDAQGWSAGGSFHNP